MRTGRLAIFTLTLGTLAVLFGNPFVGQAAPFVAQAASSASQPAPAGQASQPSAPPACEGLPPGKHALLERMTAAFDLTCEQELKIEPLLHNEESVSKPLLRFAAFSQEEKDAVMLKIKLAARRQIRPLLTAEQRKKMDDEIDAVSKGSSNALNGDKKGGGKKGGKKAEANVDPFDGEESLSQAISNYSALSSEEQRSLVLEVKQAARRDGAPQLTPEQEKKIDADIKQLSASVAQK
jgi:Spy/CpxP family protein refolding chaperone